LLVTYLNKTRLRVPKVLVVDLFELRALAVDMDGLRALAVDMFGLRALAVDKVGLRALALDRGHLDGRRIFFSALQTDCTHDHISETGQSWLYEKFAFLAEDGRLSRRPNTVLLTTLSTYAKKY
jgi:hypothetical protein